MFRKTVRPSVAFLLLAACGNKAQVGAVREIALPGKVCNAATENIAFRPANYAELRGKYDPPKVLLRREDFTELVDATWEDDSKRLVFNVPAQLPRGTYSLAISNQGQASAAELQGSLQMVAPPVVQKIQQGLWCAEAGVESSLRFEVTDLEADTAVILDGTTVGTTTTKIERHPDQNLIELHVVGGAFAAGTKFDLVITNAPGCSARIVDGVAVVGTPTIDHIELGPTLRDAQTVPPNTPFVVRVGGTQVTQASQFLIDGVIGALGTVEAPTSGYVDASFPAIAGGIHSLGVKNGGCGDTATAPVKVASTLPLQVRAANPTAITAGVAHYVDFTTALSDVTPTAVPKFFVDVDPTPLITDWRELALEVELNGDRTLYRVHTPELPLVTTAALDVRIEADSALGTDQKVEGFWAAAVYAIGTEDTAAAAAPAESAPRLVWKDRDHAMTGERVVVYGCFDLNVTAELVAIDASLGETPLAAYTSLLVRGNAPAEAWAAEKYRCLPDAASHVTRMLNLEVPADASPGAYRIRLRSVREDATNIVADDLYPFVVYGGTPALDAFAFASDATGAQLELTTGRKMAASTVASDGAGRKFAYLIGGGAVSGSDPSSAPQTSESPETSYEVSPVSSKHTLTGFTRYALEAEASASGNLAKTYGALALADGSDVYVIGGTSDGTSAETTGEIRHAQVVDSLDNAAMAGKLTAFARVAQMQTAGAVEVKSFGHTGAILRSGTFPSFGRTAVVVRGIEDKATLFVADHVVLSGVPGQVLAVPDTALDAAARGQAFASAALTAPNAFSLFLGYAAPTDDNVAATSAIDAAHTRFHSMQSFSAGASLARSETALAGLLDTAGGNTAPITVPEVGGAALFAGTTTFVVGGIHAGYNNGGSPDDSFEFTELRLGDPAEPTTRVRAIVSGVVTTSAIHSVTRRAYAASVFLAPNAFIVSGLVCKSDETATPGAVCDQASDRGLSVRAERATVH